MSVSVLVGGSPKVVADQIPAGTIVNLGLALSIYTGSEWLPCDGSAVSRTSYSQLFAAIGTSFGPGDGATMFNLPIRAKLSNRPLVNLTTSDTFAAFVEDTDIAINNGSAASIDISAGAVLAGIRISIIEKSAIGVTIFTDGAHTQSVLFPQGTLLLEWDGIQWCVLGKNVKVQKQFTSNGTWKVPFSALYVLIPVGGGGGGGYAKFISDDPNFYNAAAGGGGGGGAVFYEKLLSAGTTLSVTVGSGGTGGTTGNGGNGGNTTISDSPTTFTATGTGGKGGGGGNGNGTLGFFAPGIGGSITGLFPMRQIAGTNGGPGQLNAGGVGGAGGNSIFGAGGGATNFSQTSNPGSNYGGGGGGAASNNTPGKNGGAGAPGCALIEF